MTDALPDSEPLDVARYAEVLERAREAGFRGFGGACAHAAVAINRVLFEDRGQLVGCFNEAFQEHGSLLGHVAVRLHDPVLGEVYLDADGRPKAFDEIESWGMLDEGDLDHQEQAGTLGFALTGTAAERVATFEMDGEDVVEHFGADPLNLVTVLQQSLEAIVLRDAATTSPSPTGSAMATNVRPLAGHR